MRNGTKVLKMIVHLVVTYWSIENFQLCASWCICLSCLPDFSNRKQRVKQGRADIIHGGRYCLEFHMGQFWDLLYVAQYFFQLGCSIFSYTICFTFLRTLILQIVRTILHYRISLRQYDHFKTVFETVALMFRDDVVMKSTIMFFC